MLLSSASLSTQRVRSVLVKSTLIFFFNSLPLKKSSHCTASLKRQQRTAVQKRELGVPHFNKATFKRGDFTESELGFEVNRPQRWIQRDFHLSPLCIAFTVWIEQTRVYQYASGRIFGLSHWCKDRAQCGCETLSTLVVVALRTELKIGALSTEIVQLPAGRLWKLTCCKSWFRVDLPVCLHSALMPLQWGQNPGKIHQFASKEFSSNCAKQRAFSGLSSCSD